MQMRKHQLHIMFQGIAIVALMVAMSFFSACSPSHKGEVDELNSLSYAYHYRNLDSTKMLAERALKLSDDYPSGYVEACNNLAFVAMAKMDYKQAKSWLDQVEAHGDNQIELLIADVQNMRLCQREARNKDFYNYREKAMRLLRRVGEEAASLPPRERKRAIYAKSEFDIVAATYFYYVGLEKPMQQTLADLDPDELEQDTAQYLNYLYNFGSGGAITQGTVNEINQKEFDDLILLYMIASGAHPYPYWQANALQAISEHLQNREVGEFLIKNNLPAFQYLNIEQMPNELLAGNFAQRALNLFSQYGDVYQTAGANRTLAECYFAIGDYASAEQHLNHALYDNKAINQAPDLVASIREQLSMVYSAVDDKPKSDYNRNIYLDLQEQSRQDRQLEARAAQLDDNAMELNSMIAAVVTMIVVVLVLLYAFDKMRRRKDKANSMEKLLEPLREWNDKNNQTISELKDEKEEVVEQLQVTRLHIEENKKRNLEQRAKIALVNSITPFIDRMVNEVDRLCLGSDTDEVKQERYQYIQELADKINQYNDVLTQWIQMRQGTLSLRIESFALQPLFDIVAKGKMSFQMKGVLLDVKPTDLVVKADRTLTLFMINTIADNARKFTDAGGKVEVSATFVDPSGSNGNNNSVVSSVNQMVEITISDTGKGMGEEALSHVFDRTYTGGHGFGLLNCKGIIEKYKKVSSIFAGCDIRVESEVGKGSKFSFRLPHGMLRKAFMLLLLFGSLMSVSAADKLTSVHHHHHGQKENKQSKYLMRADDYADSAYFSNINGTYEHTLAMADSARVYLNRHYLSLHPEGNCLMVTYPAVNTAAEIKWLRDSLPTNYQVILDLRNESAIAALALHRWSLYEANNKVYTQLFREMSIDNTLPNYVRTMQQSKNSKTVAVILLVILLLQLPLAYYLLYYRHVLRYRYALDQVNEINRLLLSDLDSQLKLEKIRSIWNEHQSMRTINAQLNDVVIQIEQALQASIDLAKGEALNIELTEDELHRAEYENAKLHIANSVLDNCLSTLKHETMYYPSRIRQLIDTDANDVNSLRELVDYYKSLYTMLSAQAMEQVVANVKYDKYLNHYLLRTLLKGSHTVSATVTEQVGSPYSHVELELTDVKYDDHLHAELFTPLTSDLKYLLARQIVREIGEVTNLRACGIQASKSESGHLLICVVLPTKMVKESGIELK